MTTDELEVRLLKQNKHVSLDQCVLPPVAAEVLGVAEGTLKNWRSEGKGPEWVHKAQAWYRLSALVAYLNERTK